jgi:ubiquinone/menaquinone biosynthesis C-methylase UbiE
MVGGEAKRSAFGVARVTCDRETLYMREWWLSEAAHAGQEHLQPSYVSGYERKAGFDPSDDLAVLRRHGFGSDSILIDLGAGTGVFAIAAARWCRRVIAVDVSPAMTAVLRARVDELGIDNLTVVESGFLSYQHRGEPPGFVFTRNALHQLPDFWKAIALERIRLLLPPGGVLRLRDLVYDFEPAESDQNIEAWLSGAVRDSSTGWTAEELAEHVRNEFSTYSWVLEIMLERTGFSVLERDFRKNVYGAYTCKRGTIISDSR